MKNELFFNASRRLADSTHRVKDPCEQQFLGKNMRQRVDFRIISETHKQALEQGETLDCRIIDQFGKPVKQIEVSETETRISTASLLEGVYFFEVSGKGSRGFSKFLIVK